MGLNVGNISARFGLDPSEFLERLRGVSGATKFFSDEMRRSMRETSREGAESFRLIDESLGIHISRPLTRILTQEFPAFAGALQSVLGGAVVGAIATVGVEVFEKLQKSIEKAMHAQEEWRAAIRKTEVTIESVADTFARKIAETKALDPLTKQMLAGAEEAKAAFEKVSAAIEEQNKKAEAANGTWSRLQVAIGQGMHSLFTSSAGLQVDSLKNQLGTLKIEIEEAFRLDALKGTHNAMGVFQRDLEMATQKSRELAAEQMKNAAAQMLLTLPGIGSFTLGKQTVIPEQISAVKQWIDLLNQAVTIEKDRGKLEGAQSAADVLKDRVNFYRELNAEAARFIPETNPLKKLQGEITLAKEKAIVDFEAMRKAGANALTLDHALAALDRWEHRLDEVAAKAKASADVEAAAAKLPSTITAAGAAPVFSSRSAMPGGLPMSEADAKFSAFAGDQAAQLKRAAEAYDLAMTAQQKYDLGKRELDLLVQRGLISTDAQRAAMNQLDQQMLKAASSAQKMRDELQKLLERSDSAAAGIKAFGIQLQINAAENGKFAYDVLTASTKGAEDDVTKSLFAILEEQRGGHLKLIHDLEALWSNYFKNLASMGMKHGMDQLLGPLGKAITGGKGFAGSAMKDVALTENTHALMALTARMSFSTLPGAGGGAGGALRPHCLLS